MKSWLTYILLAVLSCTLATSCAPDSDLDFVLQDKSYVSLSRVVIPLDTNDNTKEHLTVESVRILIFDGGISGNIISNTLATDFTSRIERNTYIIELNKTTIEAYSGTHDVYVVLNENAFGANLGLAGVTTKTDFETIRNNPVGYNEIIAVPEGDEPPFLMCTYDKVTIPTGTTPNQPFIIDMTGLDAEDYGFSMRRTMAKIVLDEIIGGVTPKGKVIGLNTDWNKDINVDQDNTDTNNNLLIGTSELFIQKVELINVPNTYSWKQNPNDTNETYNGGYHTTGMIITNGLKLTPSGFLDRIWPGDISASGTIGFDRTDYISGIWLQETNSGKNSYGFTPVYFDITKGDARSFYSNNPDGSVELNEGNFPPWLSDNYAADGVEPGDIVPKDLELNQIIVNPAPWHIEVGKAYYIPENIPKSESFNTKLRVYYKVANVAAQIADDILLKAIQESIDKGDFDVVQNDGTSVDFSSDEGRAYLYSLGHWVFKEGSTTEAGYTWSGLTVKVSGSDIPVSGEKNGYYYASNDNVKYIDIDLNNDMVEGNYNENDYAENTYEGSIKPEGAEDHNIYRGTEYRVKLYVTKQGALKSRTVNIGGEELTITGKVVATPIE